MSKSTATKTAAAESTTIDASERGYRGSKWCRTDKRLAIYLRDGMACAYCGAGVEDGAILSLDHLLPNSKGGGNHEGQPRYLLPRLQQQARQHGPWPVA